jgi:hypothetical protein
MGYAVVLNGQVQTGCGINPFPVLRVSMDPQTWRGVARILEEELDPANGGDERLYRLLRRTQRVSKSPANEPRRGQKIHQPRRLGRRTTSQPLWPA